MKTNTVELPLSLNEMHSICDILKDDNKNAFVSLM